MERILLTAPNLIVIGLGLFIIAFSFIILSPRFQKGNGLPIQLVRKARLLVGLYLLWIIVASFLAVSGFFDVPTVPPRFVLFFVVLVTVVSMLLLLSKEKLEALVSGIPPHALIYFQSFRVIVEVALWMLFLDGLVPREMSFEGRNVDILIGLLAPVAGYLVQRKQAWKIGLIFNFMGLAALLNIVTIVILAVPSPFRQYDTVQIASYFPGILIPCLLAPAATYIHILSIRQLLSKRSVALIIAAKA